MRAHPDVGEGASPLPVRPGRAFYLRGLLRGLRLVPAHRLRPRWPLVDRGISAERSRMRM